MRRQESSPWFLSAGSSSSLGFPYPVTDTRRHEDVGRLVGVGAQPPAEGGHDGTPGPHIGRHLTLPRVVLPEPNTRLAGHKRRVSDPRLPRALSRSSFLEDVIRSGSKVPRHHNLIAEHDGDCRTRLLDVPEHSISRGITRKWSTRAPRRVRCHLPVSRIWESLQGQEQADPCRSRP